MKPRSIAILLLALVTMNFLACKKTEKGESKRWESGLSSYTALSATYPAFKSALAEQRESAEAAMKAAKAQEDKKKRVSAMSKANNLLSGGFVGQLKDVDARIKTTRKTLIATAGKPKTPEEKSVFAAAKVQVDTTLASVEVMLKSGAVDAASASAVMKKVDSDLKFAEDALAEVTKSVGNREQAEAKTAADTKTSEAAAAAAAAEAVAPWTCEYCSHENSHDAKTCTNCKAARPAKK
jgi:hypothetical protein